MPFGIRRPGPTRAVIEAYGGKLVTRSQMANPELFMG